MQFKTVWKAPSVKSSPHNHRRVCPGLDCPTHRCWQQGLAVRARAADHRRGHAEDPCFTRRSSFTRQKVSCQSFLPLVQKRMASMFTYSLYPGEQMAGLSTTTLSTKAPESKKHPVPPFSSPIPQTQCLQTGPITGFSAVSLQRQVLHRGGYSIV